MTSKHLCFFEFKDRDSDAETIPDENYQDKIKKLNTWNVGKTNNLILSEGPNINLKYFKKKYDTKKEKHYLNKKIITKKKTELCKNWEIYHDCYFKDECSFAHGIEELRNNSPIKKNKNKLCKTFQEKGFCLFGKRCNYRHLIKEKLLFTYESILQRTCEELYNEMNKNKDCSINKIYKKILLKRKIQM